LRDGIWLEDHLRQFVSEKRSTLHRHPLPPQIAFRPREQHPLVGGLDLYHQPPLQAKNVRLGIMRWGGVHCEEVEDGVAAVGDGTAC